MSPRANTPSRQNANQRGAQYRKAAEAALGQLDWVINYLHRIQKPKIARVLAANRSHIRSRLADHAED